MKKTEVRLQRLKAEAVAKKAAAHLAATRRATKMQEARRARDRARKALAVLRETHKGSLATIERLQFLLTDQREGHRLQLADKEQTIRNLQTQLVLGRAYTPTPQQKETTTIDD